MSSALCNAGPATACFKAVSTGLERNSSYGEVKRCNFLPSYNGLRAGAVSRSVAGTDDRRAITCARTKRSSLVPNQRRLSVTCAAAEGQPWTESSAEPRNFFGGPQELSTPQKLVKPLPVFARHLACIGLVGAAIGAGYAIGGKVAPPLGQVGGALALGAVGAVGAHVVNSAGKEVAAVELHNKLATSADPSRISRDDVDAIAKKYGVSPRDERFSAELKDLYARYVTAIIPPGDEPLRGNEASAIKSFKNALGLDDPEAAQAHIEVGKRLFRSRLETSDKELTAQEQKTFQKLVYVTALVFGDKHTFQVPWKRVLKVTDSQIELAIRNNAQGLFQVKLEESNADADVTKLKGLREIMTQIRLPSDVASEMFRTQARKRLEGHISSALEILKSRARVKETGRVAQELESILAYNASLAAMQKHPSAADLVPGIGPVSVLSGEYDGDRSMDDLKQLYRTYLAEALNADRLEDDKVEKLSALKSVFGMGNREAETVAMEVTTRVYRRKLSQAAVAGGMLDQATSKAAFLENLCDSLRFDPEKAAQVHDEIYRQKLEQCLQDNTLSDEDVAALLRLRILLCIPQSAVDAAHEDICGRIFAKVIDDAIAAGVDGYDATMRKKVHAAREGLRLTTESAMNIASRAVRAIFLTYVKRSKSSPSRPEGARELKKLVLFSNLVVSDLIADIKGEAVAPAQPAMSEEQLKAEEAASTDEDELMPQSMRKTKSKEVIDSGKAQEEITIKDDLEIRDRLDLYRNFLLHCLSGETTNAPMGVKIVTQRDRSDFVRLAQLGKILGLTEVETLSVHQGLAEQAFTQNAKTLLADGQITPARMEQLKGFQKQLGLPAETAEKVIKSITATKMVGQIDSAVAQGKLTIDDIRKMKSMGVDIESMVNKTARTNMLRKLVDKQLSSGSPDFDVEAVYQKLPEDLGLEVPKCRPIVEEVAREKLKSSLVQAVANLRQKKHSEVAQSINNLLASDKALPNVEPLKWAVRDELLDLYSLYVKNADVPEDRRARLRELLGIDEAEAENIRDVTESTYSLEAQEEEEFAF